VFFRFTIRGQQTSVEDVMDSPGRWELELISDWRNSLIDNKGAMTFGGEFGRPIRKVEVLRLQPDSVSNFELVCRGLFYRSIERFFGLPPSLRCNFDPVFCSLILRSWSWLEGSTGEVPQQRFDGSHFCRRVREVVVGCRCDREPLRPIVLLFGGQVAQVEFYPLILAL